MTKEQETIDVVQEENGKLKGHDEAPVTSAFASLTRAQCVKKFWRLYAIGLGVSLAGMYAGYANSVIGSIIANEGFIEYFATVKDPDTGKPALNAQHISLWSACYFVTSILIQTIAPVTADRFGRKFNMWGVTFFLTMSIIIQVVAPNWWVLLIARLVAGCAGGMLSTSVMVYMSEIAMPQFRGALLGSFSLAFALGQVFLAIALKVLVETKPMAFRNIFYSEFVFTGLWLFPMVLLPESPAWYASKGRHDEGKKALRKLIGNVEGYDVDHEYAVIAFEMVESKALAKNGLENADWKALFTSKTNMKRAVISTLPFTFQNIVGVPLMFGYTTYFFQLAGVDDPFLGNIVKQMVLVVGIIIAFYTVDKVGRRTLVIGGGVAMALICFIVGGLGFMEQTSASGMALVALCSLWAFVYANSLAPIGWISLVELSTPSLRAKTTSIAVTIQYLTGILFNYTVPLMLSNQNAGWGQKIGLFFGGITLLYLIPVVLLFPETKGRTYHELDELFERRVPAWRFASTKTSHQSEVEAKAADDERL
ncbi:general substrate transporter [Thelonectria olida]|uniref:General substrate transporter n=1 Tax=Thelonectria olida TaxID=1576542 RepID=A0A9P9AIY2_9HYPO|nr:general substrate transporter [Thelonectria olida]